MNSLTFFAAGPENKCQGIFVSERNNLLLLLAYSEINYPVLLVTLCVLEVLPY